MVKLGKKHFIFLVIALCQGFRNTMPNLSDQVPFHSGQVQNFYYLFLDKYNVLSQYNSVFHIFMNYYELTSCIENSVVPDQLDLNLHCFQEAPADQDPYCLQELIYIWFHTVLKE